MTRAIDWPEVDDESAHDQAQVGFGEHGESLVERSKVGLCDERVDEALGFGDVIMAEA